MGSRVRISTTLLLRESLRALSRHKMRSALSAVGIMIGIAAVVWVVAIGKAGAERAEAELAKLGDNLVWVEAGSRNVAGVRTGTHGTTSLTIADAEAILRETTLIKSVSPQADGSLQVMYGNRNWSTRYRGVSPSFLEIRRWRIAEGAAFTDEDVDRANNVCLIGQTVRQRLFAGADGVGPVGQTIRMNNQLCLVVGVLGAKGQSTNGQDQDDTIFVPYTTAQKKIKGRGHDWLDDVMCSAVSARAVDPAIAEVTALLRQRHDIRPGDDDDFNIRRPDELINAQIDAANTMALLLTSIACVALAVGGIGIMNVMLASVAQRTAEIGLRLALGATEWAVQAQFLGEAVMLSLLGGVAGVTVSVVGSFVLERLLQWTIAIPLEAVALALGFSAAVGILFGYFPARQASRLDPIAALRNE